VAIENEINITVVFPDSELPENTRGVFENQNAFRQFVNAHQDGSWDSELHARPTSERMMDHYGSTIVQAFPKIFPYGHSGFEDDPAVIELSEQTGRKTYMKRDFGNTIRKLLLHRNVEFQSPRFNLIANNLLMKQSVFQSAKIYCNCKRADTVSMGDKFGNMTANELENAITAARQNVGTRFSGQIASYFLSSINASCRSLPHTNEASMEARKIYFSYLIKFGLPCIFLTVTPDDQRNYRIVLYDISKTEYQFGVTDVKALSEQEILMNFKMRKQARVDLPGLCAEEYRRIMDVVTSRLFRWDSTSQTAQGTGAFGELLGWTLATEEQGRKTLHGHMLLFVKNWKDVLKTLQTRQKDDREFQQTSKSALDFYRSICSASLFNDFASVDGVLNKQSVFHHECSRERRRPKAMRYTCEPVADQILREMRHKQLCHEHGGHIATCLKCKHRFTINDVVSTAIKCHMGANETIFGFPDRNKRLERYLYESYKNYSWWEEAEDLVAFRYFVSNAMVNVHLPCHATRCFKKGEECYANLPDSVNDKTRIVFEDEPDLWADCFANRKLRFMLRFYPLRDIGDVFMNTHSPILTNLLLANTNVMFGMNGQSVFYVTGYNIKAQQKEENYAFERLSETIMKTIARQEEVSVFLAF